MTGHTTVEDPPGGFDPGVFAQPGDQESQEDRANRVLGRLDGDGYNLGEVWETMRSLHIPVPQAQSVSVAYVMSTQVDYSWHHSMMNMVKWDEANTRRLQDGGFIAIRYGTDGLVASRNKAVGIFLQDKPADWLFWIDTDQGFAPDTIERLMSAADPVDRPIVGGLCFAQKETGDDGLGGWRTQAVPTIYDWAHEPDPDHPEDRERDRMGFAVRWDYPPNTLIRCDGTGSACILIHRSAFEKIFSTYGPTWYDKAWNSSMLQETSEDLSFCMRAKACGLPVHVLTGVRTSHRKTLWLSEEHYWAEQARLPRRPGQAVDLGQPPPSTPDGEVPSGP